MTTPKKRISRKKKVSLVLSGGGTKAAAFHIGVAYALREYGFEFFHGLKSDQNLIEPHSRSIQTYVGSSGGSFVATFLAAGYSLENISQAFLKQANQEGLEFFPKALPQLQYSKMFKMRPELAREQVNPLTAMKGIVGSLVEGKLPSILDFKWLKMTGIFSTLGLEQFLREEVLPSNRFQDYRPELFIVSTKLNDSQKVVFGKQAYAPPPHDPRCEYQMHARISDAIAASASLPVIFTPYLLPDEQGHEHYYIDGEIRETLSTHVAVDAGSDLVFTSYTHQPYRFVKEIGSLTKLGLPAIIIQSIYILIEQKINSAYESYRSKKAAMNAVFEYCKGAGLKERELEEIMQIMERELHQDRELDIIPIHPNSSDTTTFLSEHFTLSPKKLNEIVKAGYKAGMSCLSRYEFE